MASAWAAPAPIVERLRADFDNYRGRDEVARRLMGAALHDMMDRGWVVSPTDPAELLERLALPPRVILPCWVIGYAYVPLAIGGAKRSPYLLFSRHVLRICGNSTALTLHLAYLLGELRVSAGAPLALVCFPGGRFAALDAASLARVSA
jgi:hypothetical protein